ncbi:hypothetical protein NMG60_11035441 [Bertholletia excelsa]
MVPLVSRIHVSYCSLFRSVGGLDVLQVKNVKLPPYISPTAEPRPLVPLLAPSPLMVPFIDNGVPKLSGLCTLNFSAVETVLNVAATDCWDSFAPYLANVVCCPQVYATLTILIGQSSKQSGQLALNATHAKYCLSDLEQILEARGSASNLQRMCSIHPSNLTSASCPIVDVNKIERIVDSSSLLAACGKTNPVNECCSQVCQNAISEAARLIALKGYSSSTLDRAQILPEHHLNIVNDCKSIVLRWLASKLDPSSANSDLRVLLSCNINKDCPLLLPDIRNVTKDCANMISNQTACCNAMESYLSILQEQSLITNLQALNCAALLGLKLQKANVSSNIYNICQISLKDFSLQGLVLYSGCLLPSLPLDVTFDKTDGVSFTCDLNDNVAAPWPSSSFVPSSCNKTMTLPTLPKATSAQSGLYTNEMTLSLLFISFSVTGLLV